MKLLLILLFCLPAMANPWTHRQDISTETLLTSFNASVVLNGPKNSIYAIQVDNRTDRELEVNCSQGAVPSNNSVDSFYVAPQTGWSTPDNIRLGKSCWWRAYTTGTSTGVVRLTIWGY